MGWVSCYHQGKKVTDDNAKGVIKNKYSFKLDGALIREGNYSKIFLAESKEDPEKEVIIKWIAKNKAFGQIDNIDNEIKKLIAIWHPNINKYIEIYQDSRTIFIVMEYIKGELLFDTLSKRTENSRAFSEYEAALIMKKLLQAMQFCHKNHIMHKDIKPKKILLTRSGEIKLIDFGLSKWKTGGKIHTASGSPYYLAPEVIEGVKTTKSDIWSLGVLLYCLLSGTLPFVGDEDETIFDKVKESDVNFETRIWSHISSEVQDLILKMIDKDYTHRYNTEQWLAHEWFAYALSAQSRKESMGMKVEKSAYLSAFIKKWELETEVASMIDQYVSTKEIQNLEMRFDQLTKDDNLIDKSEIWNSVCLINESIDKEKFQSLTSKLSRKNEKVSLFFASKYLNLQFVSCSVWIFHKSFWYNWNYWSKKSNLNKGLLQVHLRRTQPSKLREEDQPDKNGNAKIISRCITNSGMILLIACLCGDFQKFLNSSWLSKQRSRWMKFIGSISKLRR
jgi:serine/threonine protein kinase